MDKCLTETTLKKRVIAAIEGINACMPTESGVQAFTSGMFNICNSLDALLSVFVGQAQRAVCYANTPPVPPEPNFDYVITTEDGDYTNQALILYSPVARKFTLPNLANLGGTGALYFNPSTDPFTLSSPAGCPMLEELSFPVANEYGQINAVFCVNLASISAPLMVGLAIAELRGCRSLSTLDIPSLLRIYTDFFIDESSIAGAYSFPVLQYNLGHFEFCGSLITSFSAPLLTNIGLNLKLTGNPLLTSVSLPSWITLGTDINCNGLTALTSFTVGPTFRAGVDPSGSFIDFNGCALDQASVDNLLIKLAAQTPALTGYTIDLQAGTNAAPSGAAIAATAALVLGGNTVTTN